MSAHLPDVHITNLFNSQALILKLIYQALRRKTVCQHNTKTSWLSRPVSQRRDYQVPLIQKAQTISFADQQDKISNRHIAIGQFCHMLPLIGTM
ncbi:hypothetical protein D9M68_490880 [compost metagenome]